MDYHKDLDILYFELGEQIAASQDNAFPIPPQRYKKLAQEWLEENQTRLQEALCGSPIVQHVKENGQNLDSANVVAGIADLLAGMYVGISPFSLAILIFKLGVNKFCP